MGKKGRKVAGARGVGGRAQGGKNSGGGKGFTTGAKSQGSGVKGDLRESLEVQSERDPGSGPE